MFKLVLSQLLPELQIVQSLNFIPPKWFFNWRLPVITLFTRTMMSKSL